MADPSSPPDELFAELQRLIAARAQLEMDAGQAARLEKLVTTNSTARRMYVEYMLDSCSLHWWAGCEHRPQHSAVDEPPMETERTAKASLAALPAPTPEALDSLMGFGHTDVSEFNAGSFFWSRFATFWIVALMVGAAGLAGLLSLRPNPHQPETITEPTPVQLAHGRVNSVWLESGITKLSLDKIGTVIVEGPSDFELIGPMRARLTRGRIRMHVTEPTGRGFVVETPKGEVTDLGTEFGIDVSEESDTGVVVFQGSVDLALASGDDRAVAQRVERLVRGEGVVVSGAGQLDRIMSIITGGVATFQPSYRMPVDMSGRVIAHVADNVRAAGFRNFYEIVPGGLKEDALAYADRPEHDWNGIDERGMPGYLIGADYVKTFNDDKMRRDVKIYVTLAKPARLFVFLDDRVSSPDWLRRDFRDTGDDVGLDVGTWIADGVTYMYPRGTGPGQSIDERFSVWECVVQQPGIVELGPNLGSSEKTGMYAIAAVGLETGKLEKTSVSTNAIDEGAGNRER